MSLVRAVHTVSHDGNEALSFAMAAFEFLLVVFCERMVATSESMTDMPE